MKFTEFNQLVKSLNYGKGLPEATYIIRPCEWDPQDPLHSEIKRAELAAEPIESWNLLKLHKKEFSITFLCYPDFEQNPHPALVHATKINLNTGRILRTDYSERANPPILHRKETFLPRDHSQYELFSSLTKAEEQAGLYRDTSRIGLRLYWESLLRKKRLGYEGHDLIELASSSNKPASLEPELVERHRTAIKRYDLSKPVKLLIKHALLKEGRSFFDYGCGRGMDIEGLESLGYNVGGWDPAFQPDGDKVSAEVVNLGYVLNVIEQPAERVEALKEAFKLCENVLIVSVLPCGQETGAHTRPMGDGFLTKSGTFQKFYAPGDLEDLIAEALKRESVTLALGICLVFRHEDEREKFVSSRARRIIDWSEISSQLRFSQPAGREQNMVGRYDLHKELMDSLWETMLELGRAPEAKEFDRVDALKQSTGGLKRSVQLALTYHGPELLKEARRLREEDVLVYLAMKNFERCFLRKHLPDRIKHDIKTFFGDFDEAKKRSNELLFASGDTDELKLALEMVECGHYDLEEEHFSFHRSLLDKLPAILRVYVFCGLRRFGDLDEVDVIKIHVGSGKLTLQRYDDFDGKPLPELQLRIKIDLRQDFVTVFDHTLVQDRQLLYFKERFVEPNYVFKNDVHGFSKRLQKLGFDPKTIGYGPSLTEFTSLRNSLEVAESIL